ncbi:sugar phosphate isomerase/epimerase [Simiduia curdlanivorans]|uniref:Sugar phosphate isomerase/epimerase family protein n=1 Tax=Simiduia curdlanivorans TaxID=1492769 RepID=A0ABV8V7T0_9GAMM|nr:sugar phosphate isomerase/epimerase [Simiduia curdlanivorans]MDN3639722.1 sugar phosphate isomerase/epimerase [Simiduia curdlanivorans]
MPNFSVQTYTVRKHLKSLSAIEASLTRLKAMGVNAIELARIKWTQEEIATVARVSQALEMTVGSSQNSFDFLSRYVDQTIQFHQQLDCRYISVSALPMRCIIGNEKALAKFAVALNSLGEVYRQQGFRLLFHHHHFEFQKYGHKTGLDILLEHSSAENIGLTLDTYWLQRGGKTPHDTILELSERVDVVHLRDYQIRWKYLDLLPTDAALGVGHLHFGKIVESCKHANVAYMAIEQETKTPFDDLAKSIQHLKNLDYGHLF